MSKNSDAWLDVSKTVMKVEADLAKAMQTKHGLGLSEFRALGVLSQSPDLELRMQDLAAHLLLNQSSVSRMVERLERAGLVIRDLCPDDKRGVYTVLTQRGQERLEQAQPDYEAILEAALKAHGAQRLLRRR